ncbi:MAG: glutaredoxin family protein [Steroidobacteraceae bacterium]
MPTLELLSRDGCGLCEEMQRALEALRTRFPLPPVVVVDIDSDPALQRRFILEIPVLRLGGDVVCFGRLDEQGLLRALGTTRTSSE